MTLARLIEAVEAGSRGDDFWSAVHVLPAMHITDVTLARDGSLDAAKRLHDALLPEWTAVEIRSRSARTRWVVDLSRLTDDGEQFITGHAADPARAFLLAILRAMEWRDG